MESLWFIVVVTICVSMLAKSFLNLLVKSPTTTKPRKIPPGSLRISTLRFLYNHPSFHGLLPLATNLLHSGHLGPIFTLHVGSRPHIFIADITLAHHASSTSDRVTTGATTKAHSIGSAPYGATWTALRRNLTPHFINPNNLRAFSSTREWAVGILVDRLRSHSKKAHGGPIHVIDDFSFSMYCLQIAFCFGLQLHDEEHVRRVMHVIRSQMAEMPEFRILGYCPKLSRFIFRRRWRNLRELQFREKEVLIPLIRSRIRDGGGEISKSYVDGLRDLRLPEGRGLTESEIMRLCSTFLVASTELPTCTLQWIMAELVRNPRVQAKLLDEMRANCRRRIIREAEIEKTAYLKAVVLEGLRMHPPGHLVIPHRVAEEVEVGGYAVPREAVLNLMVAEMGRDPRAWVDPMEFRPERWVAAEESGDSARKMMAFGVGRRMCPGKELALMNLEFFVGNLVLSFGWEMDEDWGVDLSEKDEFVMAMKNPLKAKLTYRLNHFESAKSI